MPSRAEIRVICISRVAVPGEHPGWHVLTKVRNVECFLFATLAGSHLGGVFRAGWGYIIKAPGHAFSLFIYFFYSCMVCLPFHEIFFIQTVFFSDLYSHCSHNRSFEVPIVFLGISRLESWFQSMRVIFGLQTCIQPTTVDLELVNFTRNGVLHTEMTTHPRKSTEIFMLIYQPSWKMFSLCVDWHLTDQIKISVLLTSQCP